MKKLKNENESTFNIETEDVSSIYYSPPHGVKISQLIQEYMLNEVTYKSIDKKQKNKHFSIRYDYLTGLPTQRFIIKLLEEGIQLAKEKNEILSIFYLKVMNFKLVNHTYGHVVSNQILVIIAKRLRKLVQSGRQLSRFNEDEFLMSLMVKKGKCSSINDLEKAALISISEPITIDGLIIKPELNVEIVAYPIHGNKVGVLIDIVKLKNDRSVQEITKQSN